MSIIFHLSPGQILLCDFSDFKEPEMVKKNRPVIVLSSALKGRDKLLTIVPLSTVKPDPIQPYHCLLLCTFLLEQILYKPHLTYPYLD